MTIRLSAAAQRSVFMVFGIGVLTFRAFCQTGSDPSEYKYIAGVGYAGDVKPAARAGAPLSGNCGVILDHNYGFKPAITTVTVSRVVGLGTDVDASGMLVDPAAFYGNHVVSRQARLEMAYHLFLADAPAPPGKVTAQIWFNGHLAGTVKASHSHHTEAQPGPSRKTSFNIPIDWVKFGRLATPPFFFPIRGQNVVEIRSTTSQYTVPCAFSNPEQRGPIDYFDSVTLRFQALAPVLMIHGCCAEDGTWFQNTWTGVVGSAFNKAFDTAHIPYDTSINLNPLTTIERGGLRLVDTLKDKVEMFGAKRAHIIGHSEGGLFPRYALNSTDLTNFGVFSFTTLDTPHWGSVAPDYLVAILRAGGPVLTAAFRALIPDRISALDLTQDNLLSFNSRYPRLPNQFSVGSVVNYATYKCVAADANLDGSTGPSGQPSIQLGETRGYEAVPNPILRTFVFKRLYNLLGTTDYVSISREGIFRIPIIATRPTDSFQLNDFVVTRRSANYARACTELVFRVNPNGDNHNTVGNKDVAALVIQAIRDAERIK